MRAEELIERSQVVREQWAGLREECERARAEAAAAQQKLQDLCEEHDREARRLRRLR